MKNLIKSSVTIVVLISWLCGFLPTYGQDKLQIDNIWYNYQTEQIYVIDTIKTDAVAMQYIPQLTSCLKTYKYLRKLDKYTIEECIRRTIKWDDDMPARVKKRAREWYEKNFGKGKNAI